MKILIIRFSSIGDIVLTTPVIRCVKTQLDVELHFITKKKYESVIAQNPYIDQKWYINKNIQEVIPSLKKIGFDYIIDLHKNYRSIALRRKLKSQAYDFNKINIEKWLMVNLKINRLPNKHIVNRYLEAVSPLGVKYDGKGLDFFIPPTTKTIILKKLHPDFNIDQTYITLVIGATYNTKRPSFTLLKEFILRSNTNIIIIGGPDEKELGLKLQQLKPEKTFNTAGDLSIEGSAYLIQQSEKVITPDTGMMHIAAALDKDIISIWGNTIPEFGMSPFFPNNSSSDSIILENKNLNCRPCSKLGKSKCPKKHFNCINDIQVDNILKHIKNDQNG